MPLIWNGENIDCAADVLDWRATKLEFNAASPHCGVRKKPPQLGVIHFTGGENPPPGIYKTLVQKQYAVEFAMDYYGHIYQFCDPCKVFTAHAAGCNPWSFGIEIQSRGVPGTNAKQEADFPRGVYSENMEWGAQKYVSFSKDQLNALVQLVDALAAINAVPARLAVKKVDIRKRVPKAQWPALTGWCGHYNVDLQDDTAKIDPGPQPLDELWLHFNGK